MPRISGRSGSTFFWPIPRRPRARSVPRCLGLVPIAERTWVTRSNGSGVGTVRRCGGMSAALCRGEAATLVVGAQHAGGYDVFGREAAQPSDLVGAHEGAQAGNGGVRDVDGVRGAERLR